MAIFDNFDIMEIILKKLSFQDCVSLGITNKTLRNNQIIKNNIKIYNASAIIIQGWYRAHLDRVDALIELTEALEKKPLDKLISIIDLEFIIIKKHFLTKNGKLGKLFQNIKNHYDNFNVYDDYEGKEGLEKLELKYISD